MNEHKGPERVRGSCRVSRERTFPCGRSLGIPQGEFEPALRKYLEARMLRKDRVASDDESRTSIGISHFLWPAGPFHPSTNFISFFT
jgi:hypothetical protein